MSRPVPSNHPLSEAAFMLLLSALLVAALIALQWGLKYPWANDSAGYIEEASHLLAGQGLTRSAAWDAPDTPTAAFPLFPPGLSLATAALAVLGVPVAWAALAISWLAWLGMAPAVAWATRPLAGLWPARVIGLLAAASPAFAEWGFQALSDAPMIFFSVLALGLLARVDALATLPARAWAWSGVFAGLAYLFRNAGAVLPLTVIALLALVWLTQRLTFMATLRAGLAWGGGFALVAFPLFAYNVITFGSIQPYFAAHGTIDYGLTLAARISLWSLLLDLSGWRVVADLAWNAKLLAVLAPFGLAAVWLIARRRAPAFPPAGGLFLLYALIGCALVVWGRSRFDWVETTLTRQMMPYAWALLALGAWALQRLAGRAWIAVAGIVLVLLTAGRIHHLWQDLDREYAVREAVRTDGYVETARQHPDWLLTPRIKLDVAADTRLFAPIRALPPDAYLVSNQAGLLRVPAQRSVRTITLVPTDLAALRTLRPRLGTRQLVLVAIPTNARLHAADAAQWQAALRTALGEDIDVLYSSPLALMVRIP